MPRFISTQVLRFITQLLHPTAVIDNSFFPAPQIFWDRLVQLGSSQLILPAIYGALKRKKLVEYAPKDLISYLQEIKDLNYKRNMAILKQIAFLSEVFIRHQVDHVFLKGAALLVLKPYDTLNERMIGDIDILVADKDLLRAQQILIDEGFKEVSKEYDFTKDLNFAKHLKRIVHTDFIAAVEIHRKLLDLTLKQPISSVEVLNDKFQNSDGFYVPSRKHLWQHTILNWQYNDSGIIRNNLAFRTVLDVINLESKDELLNLKKACFGIKHFYSLLSFHYENYTTYYYMSKLRYRWQLKYKFYNKLNNLYFRLFYLFNIAFIRLGSTAYIRRVISNPNILRERILNFWSK